MQNAAQRLGLPVLAGLGVVVMFAGAAASGAIGSSAESFERIALALAVPVAVIIGVSTRPAWPLSIGIALSVYAGFWDVMAIPFAIDRLFIGIAIVSALVRARIADPDALRMRPVDLLLAVAALYAIGSAAVVGSLDDSVSYYALLDRFSILGFVLFFVAPKVFRTAEDRMILLGTLVVLGGYLGLTALLEATGADALVFPAYITDPDVGTHIDRARGPFAEAAANGMALFFCAVACVLAATQWQSRRARQIAIAIGVLCAFGILFTVTRAAWIAAGGSTIVAMLFARELRPFLGPLLLAGGVGVIVAFALVPGLGAQASERTDDQRPIWDRVNTTAAALRMLEDRPAFGHGWDMFEYRSGPYYRQSQDIPLTFQRNLHNVYLSNAVELGLVGALLWLFACAVALVGSLTHRGPPELRPWRIGLVAILVCYAVSALSTPLAFLMPTLLLWTWAGLLRVPAQPAARG